MLWIHDSNAEADENRVQLIGVASLARAPVVLKRRRYAVDAMSTERLKLDVCAEKPSKVYLQPRDAYCHAVKVSFDMQRLEP